MAYKRRFGNNYDEQIQDENRQRSQKRPAEEVDEYSGDEVVRGTLPNRPSAKQVKDYADNLPKIDPTKPIPFLQEPRLYSGSGKDRKINPTYDTSIGQDVLAGARTAMQGATGNPFHDLGLAIGGLGGGALNKNLKGKLNYQQDVKEVREQNRQIDLRTQAQIRLDAEQRRMEAEQRRQASEERRAQFQDHQIKTKDRTTRVKENLDILNKDSDPESRQMALEALKKDGMNVSDEYGKGWKPIKVGDYLMRQDRFGNVEDIQDPDTGEPISTLTTSGYLDILKKVRELSDYEDGAFASAVEEAKKIANGLSYQKPQQKSAAVVNIAKEIMKNQGKKTGKVTIGGEIHEIDIPSLKTEEGKPMPPKQDGGSQFMPPLGNDENKVYDATDGEPPKSAAELVPKYQDFKAIPANTDLDPESLPVDNEPFVKMLSQAEASAPKGATVFTFKLEGATYKYNFKTKKLRRVQ